MSSTKEPFLGGKLYDRMKFGVQICLPAVATFYFTIAAIWNLPEAEKVMATLSALAFALGTILQLDNKRYQSSDSRFDGTIKIWDPPEGPRQMLFEVPTDPNDMEFRKEVTFKIDSPAPDHLRT